MTRNSETTDSAAVAGAIVKAEIKDRIYLTGSSGDYQVHHDMPGSSIVCYVPTVKIGNAIVRALRELAESEITKINEPK